MKDYCKKIWIQDPDVPYALGENFKEAVSKAMLMYSDNEDEDTLAVLDDPRCEDAGEKKDFWVMCGALKRFYAKEKRLPVNGTIPDMTSLPEWYIALQHVYRNKGLADIELIKGHISEILTERGIDQSFLTTNAEEIVRFSKNSNTL
jgi:amyloid beta precursor protein binding protein 1